ncbi:hypothetical protein HD597_010290 [Nonomuraea thailandensis]|uniref:Uncharacterized protein n=1 Tax=Nonomuraea thailandensis TaxID=1188745 RepID=A0A9X2GSN4_9ACTN|nr:hypothetical protein [Nonomuraea thailandensis]
MTVTVGLWTGTRFLRGTKRLARVVGDGFDVAGGAFATGRGEGEAKAARGAGAFTTG